MRRPPPPNRDVHVIICCHPSFLCAGRIHPGPAVSSAAREALLPAAASEDVIETTGSAGDVLLTHPLLLHARYDRFQGRVADRDAVFIILTL